MSRRTLPDDYVAHCPHCGRQMVPRLRRRGFDCETGERKYERVVVCPRYDRQWRNLWVGGWGHQGQSLDYPFVALVWR